jgi:hypothetical protein
MMMIMIMGHECKKGDCVGGVSQGGGKGKDTKK